jgi:quinol monooxygenase YgiN
VLLFYRCISIYDNVLLFDMTKLVEMDEKVKFSIQMEEKVGPVVFIKLMKVETEDVDQFLKAWAKDAAYFKNQPGHISAQLHRGIGGSNTFINYAIWESTEHVKKKKKLITLTCRVIHPITLPIP